MISDEHIVGVAMIGYDGLVHALPRPMRHHNIIHFLAARGYPLPVQGKQGFITSNNRFVDRVIARMIAIDAGQVKMKDGNAVTIHDRELFSEDLW